MKEEDKAVKESKKEKREEDIFDMEEIKIEEMAIDGICGVY
jgi:mycofactocin precursor